MSHPRLNVQRGRVDCKEDKGDEGAGSDSGDQRLRQRFLEFRIVRVMAEILSRGF